MAAEKTFQGNVTTESTTTSDNVVDLNNYKTTIKPKSNKYTTTESEWTEISDLIFQIYQNYALYNSQNESYNKDKQNIDNNKGGRSMSDINWQDKYLNNLDDNIKEINQNLANTENRISDMINKHIEYSTHLDKQRHEENMNLNKKIDSSINDISSKIDATNKWIIGLVITTMIGIAAIVVATLTALF